MKWLPVLLLGLPQWEGSLVDSAPYKTISDEDLDHCLEQMEEVSKNGQVGPVEYVTFLEDISGESLLFEEFDDLPLSLIMVFYTAACVPGRSCDSDEPGVALESEANPREGILSVFCAHVADVAVLQIQFKFQYQVSYPAEYTLEQALSDVELGKLEDATELALFEHFGCEPGQRRIKEEIIRGGFRNERKMQQIEASQCDFNVHARILYVFDLDCFPEQEESEGVSCALVSSEVIVTAAVLDHDTTVSQLREDVANTLRSAFTNNQLSAFLQSALEV